FEDAVAVVPRIRELDAAAAALVDGARVEVRQLVRAPRRLDRDPARRVEAEEPDPGLVLAGDVRTHVQLWEGRDDRQGERAAEPEAGDQERRDPEPGAAVVL